MSDGSSSIEPVLKAGSLKWVKRAGSSLDPYPIVELAAI